MRSLVGKNELLYRTGYLQYMNPDGSATSRTFKLRANKNETELSVDVASLTIPTKSIKDPLKFALYEIRNSNVLELGLQTLHDPLPNSESIIDNPAHAVIIGIDINDEIIPAQLARASKRIEI